MGARALSTSDVKKLLEAAMEVTNTSRSRKSPNGVTIAQVAKKSGISYNKINIATLFLKAATKSEIEQAKNCEISIFSFYKKQNEKNPNRKTRSLPRQLAKGNKLPELKTIISSLASNLELLVEKSVAIAVASRQTPLRLNKGQQFQPDLITECLSSLLKAIKVTPASSIIEDIQSNYDNNRIGIDVEYKNSFLEIRNWIDEVVSGVDRFVVSCAVNASKSKRNVT